MLLIRMDLNCSMIRRSGENRPAFHRNQDQRPTPLSLPHSTLLHLGLSNCLRIRLKGLSRKMQVD